MNGDKAFFDTNVLLYMYGSDAVKRSRAIELYEEYTLSERMLISTQVVQEFYSVGSRRVRMPRALLHEIVAELLTWPVITIWPAEIVAALEIEERYRISFWDALILAAAESGGADVLFTEDLNDGQQYGTVTVRNPFRTAQPAH